MKLYLVLFQVVIYHDELKKSIVSQTLLVGLGVVRLGKLLQSKMSFAFGFM
jgi:hypothetical protein